MLDTRYWMLDISRNQSSSIQNPVSSVSNLFAIVRCKSPRQFCMINDEVWVIDIKLILRFQTCFAATGGIVGLTFQTC